MTVSSNQMKKKVTKKHLNMPSEYFGQMSNLDNTQGSSTLSSSVQLCLAQLALELSSGGFNEIMLASWNNLRHQQNNPSGSEEERLRIYSFLSLAHFFVTFTQLRCASDCKTEPSIISVVANIFDKHVFHWLRMTWEQFEETKSLYGMVLVSGLVKEMISFLDIVIVKGSHADKFACEALVSEILWNETNDDFLFFFQTAVKRYDPNTVQLIYLANVVEGLHTAACLLKRVSSNHATRGDEFYDERMVDNHVRLLACWHLNPQVLNNYLVSFLEEVFDHEVEHTLHEFNNLHLIYSSTIELVGNGNDHSGVHSGLRGIKRVTAAIIGSFMKNFYPMNGGDVQAKHFIDVVFS
mmetsp:Transcript_18753/g.46683  ORF Transcript_18753/g.46683 Transcript_18753/m.46683 type:complete len:352 (-) Transcript_18753:1451-2506(-)